MNTRQWLHCPVCGAKTRVMLTQQTVLRHFPLFCPKCKAETIVHVTEYHVTVTHQQPL